MFTKLTPAEREEIMWQNEQIEKAKKKRDSLNFDCFEKFIGHSVLIKNELANEIFRYDNLQIDHTKYNGLVLIDGNNGLETFTPYNNIYDICNINDDLYSDKILINAVHYDLKIVCAEEKFIYPRCYRCNKEILIPEETIWTISGTANYNSHYDDPEENMIINSLSFCDNCVRNFVGEVESSFKNN